MSGVQPLERAGFLLGTVLAFGLGVLVGGRACAPADQHAAEDAAALRAAASSADKPCAPRVVERVIEGPERIIYECPPPEPPPTPTGAGKPAPVKVKPPAALPEPEPEQDPLQRQRLLAWVRERSDDLKSCRGDEKEVYRVAVIMRLDPKTRAVRRVDVNADQSDVPAPVITCLRQRIVRWAPPEALVGQRNTLIFGLHI